PVIPPRSRERHTRAPVRRRGREGLMVTQEQDHADLAMLMTGLEQLAEVLRHPAATSRVVIAAEFDRMEELAAAPPLTKDQHCFVVNSIAGARGYWMAGLASAPYPIEMTYKKLARWLGICGGVLTRRIRRRPFSGVS